MQGAADVTVTKEEPRASPSQGHSPVWEGDVSGEKTQIHVRSQLWWWQGVDRGAEAEQASPQVGLWGP